MILLFVTYWSSFLLQLRLFALFSDHTTICLHVDLGVCFSSQDPWGFSVWGFLVANQVWKILCNDFLNQRIAFPILFLSEILLPLFWRFSFCPPWLLPYFMCPFLSLSVTAWLIFSALFSSSLNFFSSI